MSAFASYRPPISIRQNAIMRSRNEEGKKIKETIEGGRKREREREKERENQKNAGTGLDLMRKYKGRASILIC